MRGPRALESELLAGVLLAQALGDEVQLCVRRVDSCGGR
jgi:hypothetical protein